MIGAPTRAPSRAPSRAPAALTVLTIADADPTGKVGLREQPTVANHKPLAISAEEDASEGGGLGEPPPCPPHRRQDPEEADLEPTAGDEVVTPMPIHIAAIRMSQYV